MSIPPLHASSSALDGLTDSVAPVDSPRMALPGAEDRPRFLSEADGHALLQYLVRMARGGGETVVQFVSQWTGVVRWARNRIITSGEDRDNRILVERQVQGALGSVTINTAIDEALVAAVRQAERLAGRDVERVESDLVTRPDSPFRYQDEPYTPPLLFFDSTYQLNAEQRAAVAHQLMQSAAAAGMQSAGYIQVSATSTAYLTSWGYSRYFQYTWAQCSMTVRDPSGIGSGWAGVDWPDWTKIDGEKLATIALDKCLASRNSVAIEPGRYTTILEPQAVCDFVGLLLFADIFGRPADEEYRGNLFYKSPGYSRLGDQVIDERITIRADPLDPMLGFPPFPKWDDGVNQPESVAHSATWIERGVLISDPYDHAYAVARLGRNQGLPNSGAFRMSGGETTVAAMIADTVRGLLVTRFDPVDGPYGEAVLCRGCTRDGVWLIEHGTIVKPVRNMWFTESVMFALNNIEQLGPPQRVFHPVPGGEWGQWNATPQPVIVPPLKIRDFSFTALAEAV